MMARAELLRALGSLAESPQPRPEVVDALGLAGPAEPGDHASVFLFNAYPYASVYVGPDGMLGGEARDRVAGFWRAIGLTPPAEPDHIAALLGLYAGLVEAEGASRAAGDHPATARWRTTRKALLWEHLASWLPPYLDTVAALAPSPYDTWAALLDATVMAEIAEVGPADRLPLHLREAPGLPDDAAPARDWLAALLTPVRAGVVITRWDLRDAAARLGLGMRAGERAFVLRSLFDQDASGTVRWLADAAAAAAARHSRREASLGPVAAFWRERAEACEAALRRVRPIDREEMLSHGR